jgi:Iron/manganese superoxide dismutases, C-terminal domain
MRLRRVRLARIFQDPGQEAHQDGIPSRWKPILVMDMWEHAFMRDYKASERAKYVEAFFKNIDWTAVDQRLRESGAIRPAVRRLAGSNRSGSRLGVCC